MARNKLEDVRNHLFATLESLMDTDDPMEVNRAKAVADVAQTIINSAKLELDFIKLTGGEKQESEFWKDTIKHIG
jgi:hypothetical protein